MKKAKKTYKIFKIIAFALVMIFTVNIAGCAKDNGVKQNRVNAKVGIGADNIGYTVYSDSTFDKMSKELFMGYLLNGKDFTLLVLPGEKNTDDDTKEDAPYVLQDYDNALYMVALNGIYKYDEAQATFVNPESKLLLYYVTHLELWDWLEEFESDDNFMSNAMDFSKGTYNLEKPSRFKCENLVNMGRGLNDTEFCGGEDDDGNSVTGVIYDENKYFSDAKYGGMFLLFGYSSIEGYITYEHLVNYRGSRIANTLTDINEHTYIPKAKQFDFRKILYEDYNAGKLTTIGKFLTNNFEDNNAGLTKDNLHYYNEQNLKDFVICAESDSCDMKKQNQETKDLMQDVIYLETQLTLNVSQPGLERLEKSYDLLGSALLSDNKIDLLKEGSNSHQNGSEADIDKVALTSYEKNQCKTGGTEVNLNCLLVLANKKLEALGVFSLIPNYMEEKDKWNAIKEMVEMVNSGSKFYESAQQEAFSIKVSVALFNRYKKVIEYAYPSVLMKEATHNSITPLSGLDNAKSAIYGDPNLSGGDYLLLVTADGFTIERGTEDDQMTYGFEDLMTGGIGSLLSELVRMDGCPNATAAAAMYNMIANLKIYAGASVAIAGAIAVAAAGIGLAVASVISKLALVSLATPVPGGRILALVLVLIAGIIAIGVGLFTLFEGLKEKERLKGLGASETNYCESYKATFNVLFETFSLSVPIYHYNIPKDPSPNADLSINAYQCKEGSEYNTSKGACVDESGNKSEPNVETHIPLYYYADMSQVKELDLFGCPMLMYFNDGILVDSIYGATTTEFIVEMLRLWGIMAMREIVYQAGVDTVEVNNGNGNTVTKNTLSVKHTSNTNARTHTIIDAVYCFTLDYEKNLYADMDELKDFCYDASGNFGKTSKTINKKYMQEVGNGKTYTIFSGVEMPTAGGNLHKTIEGLDYYKIFYSKSEAYFFKQYKNEKGIVDFAPSSHDVTINSTAKTMSFTDAEGKVTKTVNIVEVVEYKNSDGILDTVYFITNEDDGYKYIYSASLVEGSISVKKFAKFKESFDDFSHESNDGKTTYGKIDFIRYLEGSLKLVSESSVTAGTGKAVSMPIYFTANVREYPQANEYKDGDDTETCDEGEYLYYRPNNVMWIDDKYKCIADEDVQSKDIPHVQSEKVGISFDNTTYKTGIEKINVYATSVQVGTLTVTIDDKGNTTLTVAWLY